MSLWIVLGVMLSAYAYALHKHLSTPNPAARAYAAEPLSDEQLANVTVPTLDEIAKVIKADGEATGEAYIVVGGAGLVGQYIVRALLARGETLVRIIDIIPPDPKLCGDPSAPDHISHAEFIKADITSYGSVQEAISRPFDGGGRMATVIFHTVAVIRSAERLQYLRPLSCRVNVEGTQNLLRASQELGSVRAFVFTSSAGLFVQPAMFLRFGLSGPRGAICLGDEISDDALATWNHYCATKLEADRLVRAADGVGGVRTGVLRPGMAITGPQSIFFSHYFTNPGPHPGWGGEFLSSAMNPWDLARGHIQMSDALSSRPNDVAGQAFAITGQPSFHTAKEFRRMFEFYSQNNLTFRDIPELPLFVLSHILEIFFLVRYLSLKVLARITGRPVSHLPRWAVDSKVWYMQPMMWDMSLVDVVIDDSRVRKVLGYRNYWSTAQTVKWTTDVLEGRSTS